MQLQIKGIEVDCIIGERPDERMRIQRLSVDVTLQVSDKAAQSDNLDDTVDYVALSQRIRTRLADAQCRMLERAAAIAASAAKEFAGVESVSAAVTKSGSVPGIVSATAIYEL